MKWAYNIVKDLSLCLSLDLPVIFLYKVVFVFRFFFIWTYSFGEALFDVCIGTVIVSLLYSHLPEVKCFKYHQCRPPFDLDFDSDSWPIRSTKFRIIILSLFLYHNWRANFSSVIITPLLLLFCCLHCGLHTLTSRLMTTRTDLPCHLLAVLLFMGIIVIPSCYHNFWHCYHYCYGSGLQKHNCWFLKNYDDYLAWIFSAYGRNKTCVFWVCVICAFRT